MPEDLKKLKARWYKKLEKSGFEDIEDDKGRLKSPDKRTLNFKNQESIRSFYLALDSFLEENGSLPRLHRKVLALSSKGVYTRDIAKRLKYSERWIKKIIAKYRNLILGR